MISQAFAVPQKVDMSGLVSANCSGVVVHFGQKMSAKALVLTSGHCISRGKEVLVGRRLKQGISLLIHGRQGHQIVQVTSIVYSRFMPIDLGIYRINRSYDQLRKKGVRAYKIGKAFTNMDVRVSSGLFLETQQCRIQKLVANIRNRSFHWIKTMNLGRCGNTRPGFSGSPLINPKGEIVGLVQSVQKGETYAVNLSKLPLCFNGDRFLPDCKFLND